MLDSVRSSATDSGRWYGGLHVDDDGRPTYTLKVGGEVRKFQQPVLGPDALWAKTFMYVNSPSGDGLRAVRTDNYFENFAAGTRPVGKPHKDDQSEHWYKYPASSTNLKRFLRVPLTCEHSQSKAVDLLYYWDHLLPLTCYMSIVLKAGSVPGAGTARVPAVTSSSMVKKQRLPTNEEVMMLAMGGKVDLTEDVVETTTTPWQEAMMFNKYCNRYKLYSQQLIGAWAIWTLKRVPLWYDMRVGKTWSAIAALRRALDEELVDTAFVVCPTFNMYDPWLDELESGGLRVRILDGSPTEDEIALDDDDIDVFVINYERLGGRLPLIEAVHDMSRLFVIADETSAIKNPESQRSQAMHRFCREPEFVVLLNGTPCEQGPQDMWSQMRCIDSYGVAWGSSFYDYASEWLYLYGTNKYAAKSNLKFQTFLSRTSIRYIRSEADQFAGRDKTFRYVELPPTMQQLTQSENVLAGFLETVGKDGEAKKQGVFDSYIVTAGFLREIACSYDKYREVEGSPYIRVRHKIDPKLLWVLAFLMSKPGEPVVVYCEFNEQESRLKEMLDEHGIPWSSTRPSMTPVRTKKIVETVSTDIISHLVTKMPEKFHLTGMPLPAPGKTTVEVPNWLRYDQEAVGHLPDSLLEDHVSYKDKGAYPPEKKSYEVGRFNKGEVQVFICKWSQARGFSLSRREAVKAGKGTYPTIVSLAPTWSLGSWQQGQDRCVTTHTKADGSSTNVNTMIYALTTKGSIETDIMGALRAKSDIASTLFQDAKRKGFESFVSNMLADMRAAALDKSKLFDADEMNARINLGVPPFSKLSKKLVLNKVSRKFSIKGGNKGTEAWLGQLPDNDKRSQSWKVMLTRF